MNFHESKKVRDRGIIIDRIPTGIKHCIADVKGVRVGHVTLDHPWQGDDYVATGVMAIPVHDDISVYEYSSRHKLYLKRFWKTTGLFK